MSAAQVAASLGPPLKVHWSLRQTMQRRCKCRFRGKLRWRQQHEYWHCCQAALPQLLASSASIFPTLFSYLELTAEPLFDHTAFFTSLSLLATQRPVDVCAVSVRPRQASAPDTLAVVHGGYRALLEVTDRDQENMPSHVEVREMTDLDGRVCGKTQPPEGIVKRLLQCFGDAQNE